MVRVATATLVALVTVVGVLPADQTEIPAQRPRRIFAHNQACAQQRVYIQPYTYAQPYVQQYQAVHAAPVQKLVVNEVAVSPLVVTVPVDSRAIPVAAYGVPYYYSVGDAYREKAYLRDVVREELKAVIGGAANPMPTAPVRPPNGADPGPQEPVTESLDDITPVELQKQVMAAYSGRGLCLNCHSGPTAKGSDGKPFRLVDNQGRLLKKASDKRWKVYGMAAVGAMPPAAASDAAKAVEATHLPALLQYAVQKD